MSVSKRLTQVLSNSFRLLFDDDSRIVLMSDCHRGIGGWSDNFSDNSNNFYAALTYYYDSGYTYIELGDGDELWENRSIKSIIQTHNDVFWLMTQFYRVGRLYMLYGNHDIVKRDEKSFKNKCNSFYCDSIQSTVALFPGIKMMEGLLLDYNNSGHTILLTHGHQADILNDTFWRLSRFLVRYLWRPLELIGIRDPTSAAKNNERKNKVEKRLEEWSVKNNQMIICGHTHRPVLPKPGQPMYFNDGSAVHPRSITAMEIINGTISLVKWSIKIRPDRSLFVGRDVIVDPVRLLDYFEA